MFKFIIIILAFIGFVSLYVDFDLSINNCQKFLHMVLSEKSEKSFKKDFHKDDNSLVSNDITL